MIPQILAALALVSAQPNDGIDPRLVQRLDRATAVTVGAVIDSARAAGIPVEPLVQRALQGASKRAPGARILAAVRELVFELNLSRSAIGLRSRPAEIVAGASAIHAGVKAETLQTIRASRRGDLTVPLAVLSDLISSGVPVGSALSAVQDALKKGASDQDLTLLRDNVSADIRGGASPAAAAAQRARGIGIRKTATPPAPGGNARKIARPPGSSNSHKR